MLHNPVAYSIQDEKVEISGSGNPENFQTEKSRQVLEEDPDTIATLPWAIAWSCNVLERFFKSCIGEWTWNLNWQFPYFLAYMSLIQFGTFYSFSWKETFQLLLLFGYDPHRRHEFWRFFTVMLAHSGEMHVVQNVTFQLIYGVHLELVHHWRRIAVIYVASVLGGSLLISVISQRKYAVGSSGANYGLLFANLSHIIVNWNVIDRKFCRLICLLFYISLPIKSTLEGLFYPESSSQGISHAGHLGGAMAGFFLSFVLFKNFGKGPVSGWEKKWQKMCIGILALLFIIILVINVGFPSRYLDTEWNFSYNESSYSLIENEFTKCINSKPGLVDACLRNQSENC